MNEKEMLDKITENEDVVAIFRKNDGDDYYAVEETLKPCPFCGGRAYVSAHADVLFTKHWYSIRCFNCDADTYWYYHCKTAEEAAEKWNKRVRESE